MTSIDTTFNTEFGALLRLYRTARGVTKEELANLLGLTTHYIESVERGVTRVTVQKFDEIAHALRFSAPDFLAQLEKRCDFMDDTAAEVEADCMQFLSSNRGRQMVRAMAMCQQPEVLDAVCQLLLANTTRTIE